MKSIIQLLLICLISVPALKQATLQAQTTTSGLATRRYERLTPSILFPNQFNSKAFGVYNADTEPRSYLEINTNTTYIPYAHLGIADRGDVFRTDCPTTATTMWRMDRAGITRAFFSNPGSSNRLHISTTLPGGSMHFGTNNTNRMFIADGGTGAADGFIGMGNGFTLPRSRLHINEATNTSLYAQWTNGTTGAGTVDGLKVGIDSSGTAQIIQNEARDIEFYVPSPASGLKPSMIIKGISGQNTGYIGMGGVTNPRMPLHILGDPTPGNWVTTSGWRPGLLMENHAVIAFSSDGYPNYLFMGHPALNPMGTFYCGLTPGLALTDEPTYVYRIVGNPTPTTPPNLGDFEFMSNPANPRNVLIDGNLGLGLEATVAPLYTPTNKIEINTASSSTDPVIPTVLPPNGLSAEGVPNGFGGTGFSGLRFTDLRSTSTPRDQNPGNGLLTVDENGDVIYVYGSGASGAPCPGTAGNLTSDWRLGLNGFNYYFAGNNGGASTNTLNIGYDCSPGTNAKLRIRQLSGVTGSFGIDMENRDLAAGGWIYGIRSSVGFGTSNGSHFAGYFHSHGLSLNYGVYGIADGFSSLVPVTNNFGGAFTAQNGKFNYGVHGKARTAYSISPTADNFGGYFVARNGKLNIGVFGRAVGAYSANWAGYFDGDVYANGLTLSDSTLKTNLDTIRNATHILSQLIPYSYYFKQDVDGINLSEVRQYGFCAQQVQTILPDIIKQGIHPATADSLGNVIYPEKELLYINNEQLIPFLVQGFKELDSATTSLYNASLISATNGINIDTSTGNNIRLGGILDVNTSISLNSFNLLLNDGTPAFGSNRLQVGDFIASGNPEADLPNYAAFSAIRDEDHAGLRIGSFSSSSNTFSFSSVPLHYNPLYFGNMSTAGQRMGALAIAQENISGGIRFIGLSAGAYSSESTNNVGVSGKSYGSPVANSGVWGLAGGMNATSYNTGVSGNATGGLVSCGGSFVAYGGETNYGIYAFVQPGSGGYPNDVAGYFSGDVAYTGNLVFASDAKLKENMLPLENALGIISALEPQTFDFKISQYPGMNLPSEMQYGMIAQEVEPVLPELVKTAIHPAQFDTAGNIINPAMEYKVLNYQGMIPILVAGMKEQNQVIDSLQMIIQTQENELSAIHSRLNAIDSLIAHCCQNNDKAMNQNPAVISNEQDVVLASDLIILDQNNPNPFKESTTIHYYIPAHITYAQIIFSDLSGRIIKTIDITESGNGRLNVMAEKLSSGIYSYSLIVDGKVIETKKMVCSK